MQYIKRKWQGYVTVINKNFLAWNEYEFISVFIYLFFLFTIIKQPFYIWQIESIIYYQYGIGKFNPRRGQYSQSRTKLCQVLDGASCPRGGIFHIPHKWKMMNYFSHILSKLLCINSRAVRKFKIIKILIWAVLSEKILFSSIKSS